ncbi:MAG: TonB-dependent receptor plug domain-containing protein, partial [Cyclobacteriaceae bacterium]
MHHAILLRILAVCLLVPFFSFARQNADRVSLIAYLNFLEENYDVSLAYDPDLLEGFAYMTSDNENNLDRVIENLNRDLPFSFTLMEGGYLVVKTKPVTMKLTIIDEQNRGVIPGAYVKKNEQYSQVISGPDGSLTLTTDWRKSDTLYFEFLGYETYRVAIRDLLAKQQQEILLSEGKTVLNELIITGYLGNGVSANQHNHSLSIKTEDLGMLPGDLNKDLLVSLRSLPGITTMTGRAGELRIRGGTPDQTLLLFNNIPIYHKGYYYGTISPFSSDMVDEIRVYRSGFAPRLGGRVGGAIEITSDQSIPEKTSGGLATSSVYASGFLKTVLVKNKLSLMVSARTSHPFSWNSPIEKEYEKMVLAASTLAINANNAVVEMEPVSFDFYDINSSLIYRPNKNDRFSVNFLTINNDNLIRSIDNRRNNILEIGTVLDNNGINLEWNRTVNNWNNQLFFTRAYYLYQTKTSNTSTTDGRRLRFNFQDNSLRTVRLGNVLTYSNPSNYNILTVGYELTNLQSKLEIERELPIPTNGSPPQTTNPTPIPQTGTVHSVFSSYKISEWNNFMLDVGFRSNYYT